MGLASSVGYTALQYIHGDIYLSPMMSLYVAMIGGGFGLVAASAGFWILYPLRHHENIQKLSTLLAVFLMVACLWAFFHNSWQTTRISWNLLLFPVLPSAICIFCFQKYVSRHVQRLQ